MPNLLAIRDRIADLAPERITSADTVAALKDLAECAHEARQPVLGEWLRDLAEQHLRATIGPHAGEMHQRVAPKLRALSMRFPTDSTEALILATAHMAVAPWAKLAE